MIDIEKIASGSSGNSYIISDSQTNIMIECGIPVTYFKKKSSCKLSEISGAIISHHHSDHAGFAFSYSKMGVDCYASGSTIKYCNLKGHRIHRIKEREVFKIGTFKILPFYLFHDIPEMFGFLLLSNTKERILYITDTQDCKYKFGGIEYIMIECNYSADILDNNVKLGTYSVKLAKRIKETHLELQTTKRILENYVSKVTREIHLIHLSNLNADEKLFQKEIMELTGKPVFI